MTEQVTIEPRKALENVIGDIRATAHKEDTVAAGVDLAIAGVTLAIEQTITVHGIDEINGLHERVIASWETEVNS